MKRVPVSLPELGFVAATRGMAGAGLGLLLADCFDRPTRKSVGWTLLALGVLTTVPIAVAVVSRRRGRDVLADPDRGADSAGHVGFP